MSEAPRTALGVVVLCGGRSARMGAAKAWLDFGGEPLLARVVRLAGEVAGPLVVVAAPGQDLPPLPPCVEVVRDPVAARGPLQGLAAGLDALGSRVEAAFVTATDAPFLCPAFVRRLIALRREEDLAVVPLAGGRLHPLAALYVPAVRGTIAAMLAEDVLRLTLLLERIRARAVDEATLLADPALAAADGRLRSLRNLNTPEEYRAALADAGFG